MTALLSLTEAEFLALTEPQLLAMPVEASVSAARPTPWHSEIVSVTLSGATDSLLFSNIHVHTL